MASFRAPPCSSSGSKESAQPPARANTSSPLRTPVRDGLRVKVPLAWLPSLVHESEHRVSSSWAGDAAEDGRAVQGQADTAGREGPQAHHRCNCRRCHAASPMMITHQMFFPPSRGETDGGTVGGGPCVGVQGCGRGWVGTVTLATFGRNLPTLFFWRLSAGRGRRCRVP